MATATKKAAAKPAAKKTEAKTETKTEAKAVEVMPKRTRTVLTPAQKLAKLDAERAELEQKVAADEERLSQLSDAKDDAKASMLDLIESVDDGDIEDVKALRAAFSEFIAASKELAKFG